MVSAFSGILPVTFNWVSSSAIPVPGEAAARRNLKKHPGTCRAIFVEKTDQLYRNIKGYGTVAELDIEIHHLVKENEVISRASRSSEQFVAALPFPAKTESR